MTFCVNLNGKIIENYQSKKNVLFQKFFSVKNLNIIIISFFLFKIIELIKLSYLNQPIILKQNKEKKKSKKTL